ncbi:MAG TPA: hypothetical protein VIN69_10940 [Candidatus Limnocylindria bacterium]
MITDVETWRPSTQLTRRAAVPPAFHEDEDLAPPSPTIVIAPSVPPPPVAAPPLAAPPLAAAPAAAPLPSGSPDRMALMEQLERDALVKRFHEIDRRSDDLAAEQQRRFAERLDAAIAAELQPLRERRQAAMAELDSWAAAERARVTSELAAEEQRFAERLMRQLEEFEMQLGARLQEQEQKLAGWWSEAERLAGERTRAALREIEGPRLS